MSLWKLSNEDLLGPASPRRSLPLWAGRLLSLPAVSGWLYSGRRLPFRGNEFPKQIG
jgi:hypothetical protein